jgi:S-adenosyl-L-methionine hydrolase (adenosine-forming)
VSRRSPPIVALLTDFGTQDVFVGVIKGVILNEAPGARVIDLTHEIPPGDITTAALRLWQALPFLPPETVVLAVVDPGVGTAREAVVVSIGDIKVVCPDNGLLTFVLARCEMAGRGNARGLPGGVRAFGIASGLQEDRVASATFHGRDIFAPAAVRLLSGVHPADLGRPMDELVRLPLPLLAVSQSPPSVRGEVLTADRFGNLVSSIGLLRREKALLSLAPWLPGSSPVSLQIEGLKVNLPGSPDIPFARTYGEVPKGALLAYVGSDGLLEIGANASRAVDLLRQMRAGSTGGPLGGGEIVLGSGA